jgi:hypothetical protein
MLATTAIPDKEDVYHSSVEPREATTPPETRLGKLGTPNRHA